MSPHRKILIVDDTPTNTKLFVTLLSSKGYAITTAASGDEALAQVETERPDLILLDVVLLIVTAISYSVIVYRRWTRKRGS